MNKRLCSFHTLCVLALLVALVLRAQAQKTPAADVASEIAEPYRAIVTRNYAAFLKGKELTREKLKGYFEQCFKDTLARFHIYPCWVCVKCLEANRQTPGKQTPIGFGFSKKPNACPVCRGRNTLYEVATFQARAQRTGEVFENAALYLLRTRWDLSVRKTPARTQTHDIEHTGGKYGIEMKGSAEYVVTNSGLRVVLPRAGMSRSDTLKKAESNYREFARKRPGVAFNVLTNVMPTAEDYSEEFLQRVIDATDPHALSAWVTQLKELER